MLNTQSFVVLAGDPAPWDEETRRRCAAKPNVSKFEDLVSVQIDQWQRGRRTGRLIPTMLGWVVRAESGLDSFRTITGPYETKAEAIESGCQWANADPANREFIAQREDV